MISDLLIKNLILVDEAQISFGPGLNIITGETGSGKSAILTAIRLILGERADLQWIRKGADLAVVEAKVGPHLVRRELHRSGRSRSFINDELATLQELRELPVEIVDQSASLHLAESETQRKFLDLYASTPSCKTHYETWTSLQKKLNDLIALKKTSEIEQKKMEEDLAFIEEINWKEGEEETLQKEHHLLTHSAELLEKITLITSFLTESSHPVLGSLKRFNYQLESLIPIEQKFAECAEWLKIACLNLEEVSHFLSSYASGLEMDPQRVFFLEKRLGEIDSLKRRFGSFEKVEAFKKNFDAYSNLDELIEQTEKELKSAHEQLMTQAEKITKTRKKAAIEFTDVISSELKSLNLPDARFSIEMKAKPISEHGADDIQFLFAANPGQPMLSLDRCASGGEQSRLLFAIKIALGNREKSSCLIFDEIDSNVGGKTAAILGTKLQKLSSSCQLICITHFVQVAKCALDHFLVSKKTTKEGASTDVEKLTELGKASEYERMTGLA